MEGEGEFGECRETDAERDAKCRGGAGNCPKWKRSAGENEKGEPEALLFTVLPDSDPVAGIVVAPGGRSSVPGLFGGGNREFDDCLDLLVEFGDSLVFADGLDGVNDDHLAVELDAFGGKRLGQIGGGNRTEEFEIGRASCRERV